MHDEPLFRSWPNPDDAGLHALAAVYRSGRWSDLRDGLGRVNELELWLTGYHHADGAVAVANGTVALELAFRTLRLQPGDEVLVPAITFISSASAVSIAGARPVPVDVRADTLAIDVEDARRRVNSQTRAVVAVHLGGQPVDAAAVTAFASQAGLTLVEDAAQAFGAEWDSQLVGTFGALTTHSFQAGKILAAGEGGALVIRSGAQDVEFARAFSGCGVPPGAPWDRHDVVGSNLRLNEFGAALVLSQRAAFDELARQRAATAAELAQRVVAAGVAVPACTASGVTRHVHSIEFLRLPDDVSTRITSWEAAAELRRHGVPAQPLFPPWHQTRAFADYGFGPGSCPVAEAAHRTHVQLHHSALLAGEAGVDRIVEALTAIARGL